MEIKFQLTNPNFYRISDDDYRKLPAWNNSSLGDLFHVVQGHDLPKKPEKAFNFGAAFHHMTLEPGDWSLSDWKLQPAEKRHLEAMNTKIDQTPGLRAFLANGRRELVCTWRDPETRFPCKGKIDLLTANGDYCVDLKTTSARDEAEFLESCTKYDYDRQAAFYGDGAQRPRFLFIGFQKTVPYNIYFFETDTEKPFFQQGRKRYKFLMKKAAERGWNTPDTMWKVQEAEFVGLIPETAPETLAA